MKNKPRFPTFFWYLFSRMNRLMLAKYDSMGKAAGRVLLLTTTGRKSGLARTTPLQYEEVEGVYYVASARGVQADWYQNLVKCQKVNVRVGNKRFSTQAKLMTDPDSIADFLELRLKRHPRFMGIMLRLEGLPSRHTRTDLEQLATRLAIVALPQNEVIEG